MANKTVALISNESILLIEQSGGGYSIATHAVTAGTPMAAGDKAVSAFGINLPLRLVKNADGQTFSIAVGTAVNPKPGADAVVTIFGQSGIRYIALGDGTYALAVTAQP